MTDGSPAAARARLAGAGGLPPDVVKVRILGEFEVRTDTTIGAGGADDTAEDVQIARDPITGTPLWPGTSQAGVLRARCTALLGAEVTATLFGDAGSASVVHTTDALARTADNSAVVVGRRISNRHDPATATVTPGGLYDMEVLRAGTLFRVEIILHLPRTATATMLLAQFLAVLNSVTGTMAKAKPPTPIRVGHRAGKGRGEMLAHAWHLDVYDMTILPDIERWCRRERHPDQWTLTTPKLDLPAAAVAAGMPLAGLNKARSRIHTLPSTALQVRLVVVIEEHLAGVAYPGTVLFSEPAVGAGVDAADTTDDQNATAGKNSPARPPVTRQPRVGRAPTGTSRIPAGELPLSSGEALHAHLVRLARWAVHALHDSLHTDHTTEPSRADQVLADLFGGPYDEDGIRRFRPSRVHVTERPITGDGTHPLSTIDFPHVKIDPLTQGPQALFTETVVAGGRFDLDITVHTPTTIDRAILFLALRDMDSPFAPPLGHGGGIGHGRHRIDRNAFSIPGHGTWDQWMNPEARAGDLDALITTLHAGTTTGAGGGR